VLRLLGWLGIIALAVCAHWFDSHLLRAACVPALLLLIASSAPAPMRRPLIVLAVLTALPIGFGLGDALLDVTPALIAALVGWMFARTLLRGRRPLIARAVVAMDGPQLLDDPAVARYTRRLTLVWALYQAADRMFSSRQAPFLITETNAMSIGMPWDNRPAYDGQWRQAAWALVARGAQMIEYWHWHTLHFGTETYWGGILPHSGRPGRTYAELSRLGAELDAAGPLVAALEPDADITMVYSMPSKWLMQKYPPLSAADGGPDAAAYHGIFDPFYRGAFDAGRQVRIVHAGQLHDPSGERAGPAPESAARRHPVLVVAALYVADDATLDWLAAYAAAGGHLVLGPRTGYADHEARARHEPAPGRLVEAAGVRYEEFSNLVRDVPVRAAPGGPLDLPERAAATRWADGLTVVDADVLVEYHHPHFGRWPAVTTRRHGAGRVTCVGTVPGRDLAQALAAWLAPVPTGGWRGLPASVTATTATSPDGRRVHVVHNWSWEPVAVEAPVPLTDALTGAAVAPGTAVHLGPWDVRVFASAGTEASG